MDVCENAIVTVFLYIPLRSDKTGDSRKDKNQPNTLYIPLRSDKTPAGKCYQRTRGNFISHYVQIKPQEISHKEVTLRPFISHYVQIKLINNVLDLYNIFYLYIPLRSDKTQISLYAGIALVTLFISHYVQIKRLW